MRTWEIALSLLALLLALVLSPDYLASYAKNQKATRNL